MDPHTMTEEELEAREDRYAEEAEAGDVDADGWPDEQSPTS